MSDPRTEPTFIDLKDSQRTFVVGWQDGSQSSIPYRALRLACECALCVDELTREKLLDPRNVPEDIGVQDCQEMGAYAVRIVWTDGHSTGLYPFDRLRKMGDAPTKRV
jgi:ATP-binding protein involved in chromosome partitioning